MIYLGNCVLLFWIELNFPAYWKNILKILLVAKIDPSLSPLTFLYLKSLSIVLPSSVFPLIASSSQWDSLAPASLNISRFGLLLFFTPFFGFGGLPSDGSILPAQPPSALSLPSHGSCGHELRPVSLTAGSAICPGVTAKISFPNTGLIMPLPWLRNF